MANILPAKVPPSHSAGRRLVVVGTPAACRVVVYNGDPICEHVHAFSDLKQFYNDTASPRVACPTCGKNKPVLSVQGIFDDFFESEDVEPEPEEKGAPDAVIEYLEHIAIQFDSTSWKSKTKQEQIDYIKDLFHQERSQFIKIGNMIAKAIGERRMSINRNTARNFEVDLVKRRLVDIMNDTNYVVSTIARESALLKTDYDDLLILIQKMEKTRELAIQAIASLE